MKGLSWALSAPPFIPFFIHETHTPLLDGFVFLMRDFHPIGIAPAPPCPSLVSGTRGCPCDPQREWRYHSLRRCHKYLPELCFAKLGYYFHSCWDPSSAQLLGLTPLSNCSDPSLPLLYGYPSSFCRSCIGRIHTAPIGHPLAWPFSQIWLWYMQLLLRPVGHGQCLTNGRHWPLRYL